MKELGDRIGLIVVDEAHHAAAPSYSDLIEVQAPGLFLTATPNRADNLPIGIDGIAYTITYRELFRRGCVIEPNFLPPVDMTNLDWSKPEGLADLADYLLERVADDFTKALVAVSRVERAETLYEALTDHLDLQPTHPLADDDIGYVHGGGSSTGVDASTFLDEFTARPRGILVGTSQLLGEGFDDPRIDAAVVTYPSSSISHLMQVAGRALRSTPGKRQAHIVQVHESPLEYHFEHRWLYQDISDQLRPEIIDRTYSSRQERDETIATLFDQHRVAPADRERISAELATVGVDADLNLMLSGIHYYDPPDEFETNAEWSALLVTPDERQRFVKIYNDISDRSEDIKEQDVFLRRHVPFNPARGSLYKAYIDLLEGMEYARREINGEDYAGAKSRPYKPRRSTTWLRYYSFTFKPAVPEELQEFLHDAVNADSVIELYQAEPAAAASAVKVPLPLTGSVAFLLSADQDVWLRHERSRLIQALRYSDWQDAFATVQHWRSALPRSPLPQIVLDNVGEFIRHTDFGEHYMSLCSPSRGGPLEEHS
jgi:hypothetical protein